MKIQHALEWNAVRILGIEVLDHIIVDASAEYYIMIRKRIHVRFEGEGSPSSSFFV